MGEDRLAPGMEQEVSCHGAAPVRPPCLCPGGPSFADENRDSNDLPTDPQAVPIILQSVGSQGLCVFAPVAVTRHHTLGGGA